MKSKFLLPALTAAIGFTLAWVAKPASSAALQAIPTQQTTATTTTRPELRSHLSSDDGKRPKEVKASDFPLADHADQGPKTRDEARMLRLTEALGLTIDQQTDVIKLVEDAQAAINGEIPVIQDLTHRGKMIEDGLTKVLSPQQLAKFQELRVRERENRIEVRAQKMLSLALEDIDLSPAQRDEVLGRLRQRSKAELQSIPAAATLLFDKSMLPTHKKELSVDGVLMLAKMGEVPEDFADPMAAHNKAINSQRQELEEVLRCFDGILTAGQMGQYQAGLTENREILKSLQQNPPDPEQKMETPPRPEPPPQVAPEEVPDDEEAAEDP
jgi:hypothetical protein